MPKLWSETIEEHRREVRDAILETTAALVEEHGLLGVTMSRIAEGTGIGRATLYKYFPDVEAILRAWHDAKVERHLAHLAQVRDRVEDPGARLAAVLDAYASISHESQHHDDGELSRMLHGDRSVTAATRLLHRMLEVLIQEAAAAGEVRNDIGAGELTSYCLHAISAARTLSSKAAVRRLVDVTLAGMRT